VVESKNCSIMEDTNFAFDLVDAYLGLPIGLEFEVLYSFEDFVLNA